jgi:CRISPR-associated protein Cas2
MYWLALYDITDEKRLRRVAKLFEAFGLRVQKSVFILSTSKENLENIRWRVRRMIEQEDSVAYIPLCMYDFAGKMRFGKHLYDSDDDLDQKTAIL